LSASPVACGRCDEVYPDLAGIPWLLPRPQLSLSEWRGRARAALARLRQQSQQYAARLLPAVSRASTRRRIQLLARACDDHARQLGELLQPLLGDPVTSNPATYQGLAPAQTASLNPLAYYANVHRDWCWGGQENAASLEMVRAAFDARTPGRTLVLGAGAGRLAYDVHELLGPGLTVAADINPLLLLVAQRMFAGESLELHEFPLAPRDLESFAVRRTLAAPRAARPGLRVVFADARQPPFAPASFDSVVTPWLVDVIDADLEALAAVVNRLLRPGGVWICTGTLFFERVDPAQAYSGTEVGEVVRAAGFEQPAFHERRVPYLVSPASRHARHEDVVTFAVTKLAKAGPVRSPGDPWFEDPRRPVPLSAALEHRTLALRIEGYVASLVDGRRSVADIAERLVQERLLLPDEAVGIVRDYLQRQLAAAEQGGVS